MYLNQKHHKETLYFAISTMLERASYYGLRALVILYMVGEILKMERADAFSIYGIFTGSIVFSKIIGAVIGDIIIGNKKAIIAGGIIQALGAFCLCIPSTIGLYLGLFLTVLGSGLFTPNIISNFGKSYLMKTKLLDAGFTIFYLALNLGSFLGILAIGYIGEMYSYTIGFIIAGTLMLLALIPLYYTKAVNYQKIEVIKSSPSKRLISILSALLLVGLFWGFYELSGNRIYDLQLQLMEKSTLAIPKHIWQSLNAIFILPISIIAIVIWSYFFSNQSFKLMIGFISGAISFGILLLVPETATDSHTMTYLISLVFLVISEIHIAPIVYSILTKFANPKYLAILVSLVFLPTRLISLIFGLYRDRLYDYPMLGLKIGLIGMAIIGVLLGIYQLFRRKVTWSPKLD